MHYALKAGTSHEVLQDMLELLKSEMGQGVLALQDLQLHSVLMNDAYKLHMAAMYCEHLTGELGGRTLRNAMYSCMQRAACDAYYKTFVASEEGACPCLVRCLCNMHKQRACFSHHKAMEEQWLRPTTATATRHHPWPITAADQPLCSSGVDADFALNVRKTPLPLGVMRAESPGLFACLQWRVRQLQHVQPYSEAVLQAVREFMDWEVPQVGETPDEADVLGVHAAMRWYKPGSGSATKHMEPHSANLDVCGLCGSS